MFVIQVPAHGESDIATDWIATCKKYFYTDRPLSSHFTSRLRALPRIGLGKGCCRRKAIHSTVTSLLPPAIRLHEFAFSAIEQLILNRLSFDPIGPVFDCAK
jgi:hypothetical protein